jgi:hypothetical protein
VEDGVVSAVRDAVVRERHTGVCCSARDESEDEWDNSGVVLSVGTGEGNASFVAAICVRRDARRRRRSADGYECMSKDGLERLARGLDDVGGVGGCGSGMGAGGGGSTR